MIQNLTYRNLPVHWDKNTDPKADSEAFEKAILQSLVENNDIPVPDPLIEQEIENLRIEMDQQMRWQLFGYGDDNASWPLMTDNQEEKIWQTALFNVKTDLAIQYIIRTEALNVSARELEEEARAIAKRQNISFSMVKDFMGEDLAPLAETS